MAALLFADCEAWWPTKCYARFKFTGTVERRIPHARWRVLLSTKSGVLILVLTMARQRHQKTLL